MKYQLVDTKVTDERGMKATERIRHDFCKYCDNVLGEGEVCDCDTGRAVEQVIDDIIPIIAEEMQKQREKVIEECRSYLMDTVLASDSFLQIRHLLDIALQALKQKNHD